MPVKISTLQNQTQTIAVKFGGETVNIRFSPGKVTPLVIDRLSDLSGVDSGRTACEALADILVDFDVTDEDGETLPPTVDTLVRLPYALNIEFIKAVTGAMTQPGNVKESPPRRSK